MSYLVNRSQKVVVRGYVSHSFVPGSGVPQGSNLGPLLFLLFINSLAIEIKSSKRLLFADDLKLYMAIGSIDDCVTLQGDLDRVLNWSKKKKISFNINKCNVMSFTRKKDNINFNYVMEGVVLSRVSEIKDLWVTFDCMLTFRSHVFNISSKASKMYGFIVRSSREFKDTNCIKQLYIALVRSVLEYASVIWCPYYQNHIYTVERIQNRFVKYLYFKETGRYDRLVPTQQLTVRYNLLSLEKRRSLNMLLYLHKILHNQINDPNLLRYLNINVSAYPTRNTATFYVNNARTNYYYNSPINAMCNLYSDFQNDCDIFFLNYKQYRRQLLQTL